MDRYKCFIEKLGGGYLYDIWRDDKNFKREIQRIVHRFYQYYDSSFTGISNDRTCKPDEKYIYDAA